jgi:hypothetical protein
MRAATILLLSLAAACGESHSNPGLGPCTFGDAVATINRSPAPSPGDFSYSGPATQTASSPFALAFADESLTFNGFVQPLQADSDLTLAFTSHCESFCDFSAVVSDADGLLVAAWDTSSMDAVESPGFTLAYTDDPCISITGDPVVPQIGSISLTVTSGAESTTIAAGERATLGAFTVTNGQSTVNSHRVNFDLPDRLFRGSIVRQ